MIWGNTLVRRGAAPRRHSTVAGLALLAAALILLAVPAFAAAVGFEVNGVGDGANQAECETPEASDECTLRGAIEAANASTGFSLIEFPSALFDGQVGIDEIGPGASPLPAITQPVMMFGHPCQYPLLGFSAPCVEVKGRIGEPTLKVEADDVKIEEVAFGGGKDGIQVAASADKFTARSDWFGLQLNGVADPIEAAGIVVGAASDEATIGGTAESERNVFAHAETGVELKGASKARILGNYIGVGPNGHDATELETGVRIEDFAAVAAENDEIGGVLGATEIASQECVGPCNVIATKEGQGIDLAGSASDPQQAAHGPTAIRGNFIGLEPDGNGLVGDNVYGVLAVPSASNCTAGPTDVTVGGVLAGARNYFVGGIFGIYAESAENFSVLGNAIGIQPNGSPTVSPAETAIALCAESVTEPALVGGNQMFLEPDTIGVESNFGQALIIGNSIQGGLYGIETREAGVGGGNIIRANSISGTDRQGMLIADDFNVVTGNSITKAAWAGITIEEGGEHNSIGSDALGEANTINGSGFGNPAGAIQIEGEESSRNEIAANTGSGNFGSFIELLGRSSSETPNGLKPPAVATAFQSSAVGTAAPNTTVRVFSKASAAPGELGDLLAVAKADAIGAWTATYATQSVGTRITATQTSSAGTAAAGTSELATPTAAVEDPPKPPEPDKGGGGSTQPSTTTPPPSPSMPVAPKVKITSGPKKSSQATTAKFKFKAEPSAGAKFECKLDGAKWARCSPPKTYKKLKPGRHTFRVKAKASGLTGAVAKFQFTVKS